MGGRGFICAALPFVLSLGSMICILLVIISGISDHSLDIFLLDTADLSISSSDIANLASLVSRDVAPRDDTASEASSVLDAVSTLAASSPTVESAVSSVAADGSVASSAAATAGDILSGSNVTADDLGLANHYKIFLWNYCADDACTDAKFNWAEKATDSKKLIETAASLGVKVTLPHELTSALNIFAIADEVVQILYIIAFVLAVLITALGLFILLSNCRRKNNGWSMPCLTNVLSVPATIFILLASVGVTVMAEIVVEAVNKTARDYGVTGSVNASFLATTWLAFAFSFASTVFWCVDACCAACCFGSRKDDWKDKHHDLDSDETDRLNRHVDEPFVGGYEPKQHYSYNSEETGSSHSNRSTPYLAADSPRLGVATPTTHQGNSFWPQQRKQTDEGLEAFTHRGI